MSTVAKAVSFDASTMWVELVDGRTLGIPLTWFPRLLNATPEQRQRYELNFSGSGIHWEAIDEDISVDGLIAGRHGLSRHSPRST